MQLVPYQTGQVEALEPDMVKVAATRTIPSLVSPMELKESKKLFHELKRVQDNLLPIEAEESSKVAIALGNAKNQYFGLAYRQKIIEFSKEKYQLLDLQPFKWRSADEQMPIFGVFALDVPNTGWTWTAKMPDIFEDVFVGRFFNPNYRRPEVPGNMSTVVAFPRCIEACYKDIEAKVAERGKEIARRIEFASSEIRVSLKAKFSGLIPCSVKEEIKRAQGSGLFQSLYIVAEVLKWQWDTIVVSRRGDPLVIAEDWAGKIWLLEAFDTTSLEEMVRNEFAIKATD